MGGFYTGHHIYIHRCIYTYIYTFFDPFSDQIHHQSTTIDNNSRRNTTSYNHRSSPPKKKIFPHKFTIFHKISQDFAIEKPPKTPKSPKSRKTRKNRLFGGTPPPPQKPLFSRVFGTPPNCTNLHKFAQICTNLHPQNTTFGGYPICRDPLDRPC